MTTEAGLDGQVTGDVVARTYLALHCHGDRLALVLFRNEEILQRSIYPLEGDESTAGSLKDCLSAVIDSDGFAVAYSMDKHLDAWIKAHFTDEECDLWGQVRKCRLGLWEIGALIDEECYVTWSLPELHEEIYKGEDDRRALATDDCEVAAVLAGEVFRWLASKFEEKLLTYCLNPTGVTRRNMALAQKVRLSFSGAYKPRVSSWNKIGEESSRGDPSDIKYVSFDVETHDWVDGAQVCRHNAIGRVVEIAWAAFDGEGVKVEEKLYLLRPHGYESIARKAQRFHRITTRCARERGSDAGDVFAEFSAVLGKISPDGFVIAHNMQHDDAIMYTNFPKHEQKELWNSIPKCCTMKKDLLWFLPKDPTIPLHEWQQKRYGVGLTTLHKKIAPENARLEAQHHGALADALMAWDIFHFYLKRAVERNAREILEWKLPSVSGVKRKFASSVFFNMKKHHL